MNSNDKDELDDELIKSMKKLVEEETNVAKAFILIPLPLYFN